MSKIDLKIRHHKSKYNKAAVIMVVSFMIGLILAYFNFNIGPILFVEMICFMVLLYSTLRLQMLKSIRGYK